MFKVNNKNTRSTGNDINPTDIQLFKDSTENIKETLKFIQS